MRVDASHIRKITFAFSKISGKVWTGPKANSYKRTIKDMEQEVSDIQNQIDALKKKLKT
jgi:uncharacterized protein YukE